ncbi:restriction endonuclease subunit S [Enterococcus faecium]|uniref:restriction endonuclease subunit S n=1 Tax=Enterococcus faecium TaxID=1352 RepID=UPI00115A4A6E|nr:restriction endonuclease subunit S [Enterococcus faecium]HAQ6760018.1 restriction endonuclease subunit S [Enterococcus faecium]
MTPEQLKASILQRAMEGKLVPQDPNDEPASELLKRIKAEKEKLIKEGKIKRDKNETEIYRGDDGLHYEKFADGTVKEVEVPFEIPDSWQWCRIDQLALAKGGKRVPKGMKLQEEANSYPYLRVTDMKNETILENKIQYAPPQVREVIKNYTISSEDLYITIAGTIGNAGTIPTQFDGALLTENALKLMIYPLVNKMFLLKAINSPAIQNQFLELFNQVAQPKLSIRSTNSTLIPLPPSTEQKRILARLEGVFEVLPKYEVSYAELTKLNKEFPEKLRKSILQYAMQGKLVPQDPNDERVEVLLEKIRQEKQKLFEEGKLKKKDLQESIIFRGVDNSYYEKNGNSEVKLDDIPELPSTWEYARFKDIVSYYMGKTPPRSANEYWGDDIPWVSIADMPANGIITSTKEHVSHEAKKLFKDKISPAGTLLMSFKLTVGRVSLLGIEATHNEAIISIFPYADTDESLKMYLFKFLPQIANGGDSKDAIKGTTLNSQSINNLLIPMPPLEEQSRIIQEVAKFEDLIPQLG